MKTSVRLALHNRRFDDQYTLNLQGYMSMQEFCSTMSLFNRAARQAPPPSSMAIYFAFLAGMWIAASAAASITWEHTQSQYALIGLPPFVIISALWVLWRYRSKRTKFEKSMLQVCRRINATENIKGLNYRLSGQEPDMCHLNWKTLYAIVIEFDDRYRALTREPFAGDYMSILMKPAMPAPAYCHESKDFTMNSQSTAYVDEKHLLSV